MKLKPNLAFKKSIMKNLCAYLVRKQILLYILLLGFIHKPSYGYVNLLTNGNMESSSGWIIYNLGSANTATYEFNYTSDTPVSGDGGCLRITSDEPTDILFWQKFIAKAGEVYTVDAAIKINNVVSFWAEIYVSTIPPIEGKGYIPNNNNDVVKGFSTWEGCGPDIDGSFASDACTGNGSFTIPGTEGEEIPIYFGFKTGSMADPLPNSLEVLVDNMQLLRKIGTGNSITSLSLGSITANIITIPENVTASQLKSAIQVSEYASLEVRTNSGGMVSATTRVIDGMQVVVSAENGSITTYSVKTSGTIAEENLNDYSGTVTNFQNRIINIGGISNITITDNEAPLQGSILNLISQDVWLYFPEILPSQFAEKHLGNIHINDAEAVANSNLRVVQYRSGTMVVSQPSSYKGLTAYADANLSGSSISCGNNTYYRSAELGSMDDNIESFVLKKGYMVTFAENEDGTGISRNYVADKDDIVINQMPDGLINNVSFIRVIPWRWVSKKGWCSGKDGAAPLRCSWHYDWNNETVSNLDIEYVPMRHNAGWNDFENINNKINSTHALGFNEPDRPDQANMSVDSALILWPEMLKSGLRLGSPAPSDGNPGWLFEFIQRADELKLRVDFVAVHWYKGGQTAQQYYDWLKWIYNNTGRPIWITEWNNGANWTCCLPTYEEQATDIASFLHMLDTTSFVERYSLYEWVQDERKMYYEYGMTFTPAGEVYRDNDAPLAFNGSYEDNDIIPIQTYFIVARHSGKPIEVADASLDNNALVQQNTFNGGDHQKWRFQLSIDGYYQIMNVNSGKALDVGQTDDGYICQQWSYWGGNNQQWTLVDLGNGYFEIISKATGKALTIAQQSTADSASVIVEDYSSGENQQFKLENLTVDKSTHEETLTTRIEQNNAVTLFPNPVSDHLTLLTDKAINKFSVYSTNGNLLICKDIIESNTIDVSGLDAGMYVLKIEDEETVSTIKFIKVE